MKIIVSDDFLIPVDKIDNARSIKGDWYNVEVRTVSGDVFFLDCDLDLILGFIRDSAQDIFGCNGEAKK